MGRYSRSSGRTVNISVDVDVDLGDIDTEDLEAELERRERTEERRDKKNNPPSLQLQSDYEKLYIAIGRGDRAEQDRLCAKIIWDRIGRIV